jgi:hypothetical protein
VVFPLRTFPVRVLPILALVLAGCGDLRPATRLELQTDPIALLTDDCPKDPVPPLRVVRDDKVVSFVDASGAVQRLIWPVGFAAWAVNGLAVIHAADGAVVAREGETVADIRAMPNVRPDGLRVCGIGLRTYE